MHRALAAEGSGQSSPQIADTIMARYSSRFDQAHQTIANYEADEQRTNTSPTL